MKSISCLTFVAHDILSKMQWLTLKLADKRKFLDLFEKANSNLGKGTNSLILK